MGDLIKRSDELDDRIAGSADIEALVRASRRNLILLRILAASVALDLVLSVVVGGLAWEAHLAAAQTTSIEARAKAACLSGNESRAAQVQLWHYVLDLSSAGGQSPQQQEEAEQLRAYVDKTFAPRHC